MVLGRGGRSRSISDLSWVRRRRSCQGPRPVPGLPQKESLVNLSPLARRQKCSFGSLECALSSCHRVGAAGLFCWLQLLPLSLLTPSISAQGGSPSLHQPFKVSPFNRDFYWAVFLPFGVHIAIGSCKSIHEVIQLMCLPLACKFHDGRDPGRSLSPVYD